MPAQIDFDPSVDYYKLLGVSEKATADEIKKAYRKLAKANHPDSTGGDKAKEKRFKEISNAYDVLGDDKKRKQYDAIRAGGFRPDLGGGGTYTYTSRGGGPGVFDLGDLFSQFFSGAQTPGRAAVCAWITSTSMTGIRGAAALRRTPSARARCAPPTGAGYAWRARTSTPMSGSRSTAPSWAPSRRSPRSTVRPR
jgi:molecular chaperone DnaJ